MNEDQLVYESLESLLSELQKIKDLNNLANEYKSVAADLILALTDYVEKTKQFSDAYDAYQKQTTLLVEQNNNSLRQAIDSLKVADGTITAKADQIVSLINSVQQQSDVIVREVDNARQLYQECQSFEKELKVTAQQIITLLQEQNQQSEQEESRITSGFTDAIKQKAQELSDEIKTSCDNQTNLITENSKAIKEQTDTLLTQFETVQTQLAALQSENKALQQQIDQLKTGQEQAREEEQHIYENYSMNLAALYNQQMQQQDIVKKQHSSVRILLIVVILFSFLILLFNIFVKIRIL